jgi:hypothetical protein
VTQGQRRLAASTGLSALQPVSRRTSGLFLIHSRILKQALLVTETLPKRPQKGCAQASLGRVNGQSKVEERFVYIARGLDRMASPVSA